MNKINHNDSTLFINVDFSKTSNDTLVNQIMNHSSNEFKYIVTANADHIVRLPDDSSFSLAYENADIKTCDSRIIKLLAKIFGYDIGELITGSDLTRNVIKRMSGSNIPLIIIGSESSEIAKLSDIYDLPNIHHYNPPMGFIHSELEINQCIDFFNEVPAGIVLFCVGSPQQEILAHKVKMHTTFKGVGLCVGASINFLTGKVERAPKWIQFLAMEWAFRLFHEPKRLFVRYVKCLKIFTLLIKFKCS